MVLEAIKYTPSTSSSNPTLQILDQLELPHQTLYILIPTVDTAWHAIRSMSVRGAPAIAIVAALAVAVEVSELQLQAGADASSDRQNVMKGQVLGSAEDLRGWIVEKLRYLLTSRPTAVNLQDAVGKLEAVVAAAVKETGDAVSMREKYVSAAEKMLVDDVRDNEKIGEEGSKWIRARTGKESLSVLTHCNTGSLATAGYGTALGVVRSLHASGSLRRVYYTETRPYNQGSRLTGYELLHDGIPATLITDSMAASLFQLKARSENIAAVIVGADRVAANGDTANKIGTYGLAVLARHHDVKFLVAAPRTTIDLKTKSGEDIVIEERPQDEMLGVRGPRILAYAEGVHKVDKENVEAVSVAALGTKAWNPSFDVTPAELIDGIVTEVGVVEKIKGVFDLKPIFGRKGDHVAVNGEPKPMPSPLEGP